MRGNREDAAVNCREIRPNLRWLTVEDAESLPIEEIWNLYREYVNAPQVKVFRAFSYGNDRFTHAEGMYLFTHEGRKILDFTGGLGVLSHGHNHPRILAVRETYQQQKRMEVHKLVFSPYVAALSHNLAQLLPGDLNVSYFPNSGAEAVEGAVKAAFKSHKHKRRFILHADLSYHGKLIGSGTLSGAIGHQWDFPRMEHTLAFEYGNIASLEKLVATRRRQNGASDIYAVIIEPFNAAHLIACSETFLRALRALCDREGIVLIFDEVYSGCGKCGTLFYFMRHAGLVPDALCLSKSFGGGKSSISAYVLRAPLFKAAYGTDNDALKHTTTYNGFGEECATAIEALQIMVEEDYPGKARRIFGYLQPRLEALKTRFPDQISEIRGAGAMLGVRLRSPLARLENLLAHIPASYLRDKSEFFHKITAAARVEELYREHGILTTITPVSQGMVAVMPALIAAEPDLEFFLGALEASLRKGLAPLVRRFAAAGLKTLLAER